MKVGTGGNLGLSREYHKKLFGPLFYPLWNYLLIEFVSDVYVLYVVCYAIAQQQCLTIVYTSTIQLDLVL